MTPRPQIIYLYSEVMPYAISVMRELVNKFNVHIHCIYWDEDKKTPFLPINEALITFHKRSSFHRRSLKSFIVDHKPVLLYVSGRMDKDYLHVASVFKKSIPIVTGCDNQWYGSIKNYLASFLSRVLYRRYFDFMWVPGVRQYEFAKRMGYADDNIIMDLYSADTHVYQKVYKERISQIKKYPHVILFVGRFTKVKGIELLINAFNEVKKEKISDWQLLLVGEGDFKCKINNDIKVMGFSSPDELAQISKQCGVFCLPSLYEPWGVVIHEFAVAGLPIIAADSVGAINSFVINRYNGLIFKTGNIEALKTTLRKVMDMSDEELKEMSCRSAELGMGIHPVKSAYKLMSNIAQNDPY